MARHGVRGPSGRFIEAAESTAPVRSAEAEASDAAADALKEFESAVSGVTESLLKLREGTEATTEITEAEGDEKKKEFVGARGRTALIGLFVAGLWKATRALDLWRKRSIANMDRIEAASANFAKITGRATSAERIAAAEANRDAATKRWEKMGGKGTPENLPWWARGKELFQKAVGMETDSDALRKARIEKQGASRIYEYLKNAGFGADTKAGTYGFRSMGSIMQKQLVETDDMKKLAEEHNRVLQKIERNTARQISAVGQ